jgi:hypothetical protein
MARSRLTYAEAVKVLTGGDDRIAILSRLVGGALLVASPFTGTALSLFDAKGEANALLRGLVGEAPGRIRSSRGKRHYELVEAAHTVLVLSAFFDALGEHVGQQFTSLELTDEEKRRLAADGGHPLRDHFQRLEAPMPGALRGFAENVAGVEEAFRRTFSSLVAFASGLAAGQRMRMPDVESVVVSALALYRERYVRLAADVPEFAIWSGMDEHAATRLEVRKQTETLGRLAELLSHTVTIDTAAIETERRLASHAALVLERPLWRADAPAPAGLSFPTVQQGFVSPRFRITVSDEQSRLGDELWWDQQEASDDLARFLASYLTDPASTQRPLVVLGHPGAGKSLLTEVVAARLPTAAFTAIRVPLRRVDPDAAIHQQVETTIERVVKERIPWGELCRASPTTKVVLLDGFDELVQATGVTQSHYIDLAASFQQEEWINERPVVVVITSRTLVMDRTRPPHGTVVVKLEPFDQGQVVRWTEAWNAANAQSADFRPLRSDELLHHSDLAGQPLLLLMLAIYAAESGIARLDAEDLSSQKLYRRLLDSFIRRQVREKASADLGDSRFGQLEVEGRRDLAAAAFAMYNRGRQFVSEDDLQRDLNALNPSDRQPEPRLGEPLTRARRTVAAFFFVHVAQADDDVRAPGRRTYEFLHATFAEYLVAEHTVELLVDLAEDWRRSRRRAYGANLDDRVVRSLLSHQPLTNGEQVTPFLFDLIDELTDDIRNDLQEALVELFCGARTGIEDDAYRPTSFDVVNRLAAYTANLVLLASLCGRDGVSIEALCDRPHAPSIESTVRLWRSGLDIEAQNGFFGRLKRVGNCLNARHPKYQSLSVSEAELVGDIFTESMLLGGRQVWYAAPFSSHEFEITPFQRDLHLAVLRLVTTIWRPSTFGRLMPYDERQYLEIAELANRSKEPPSDATVSVLASCLMVDYSHLPEELVDRLLVVALRNEATYAGEPLLSILAIGYPELLHRHPQMRGRLFHSTGMQPLLYDIALAHRRHSSSANELLVTELRDFIATRELASHEMLNPSTVMPSMVASLDFKPELLTQALQALENFGALAWSQVRPTDFLRAISIADVMSLTEAEVLRSYVASREKDAFESQDRSAFHELKELHSGSADAGKPVGHSSDPSAHHA